MRRVLLAGAAGCLAALALPLAPSAHADSFALNEYSARALGLAMAGRPTMADDASAAFGNPALLTLLRRGTVSGSLSGVYGSAAFDDRGSRDLLGRPLGGDTVGFLEDALLPGLQVAWPLSDRFALGFAVTVPFGLATEYDSTWPGRYQAVKSSLQTIDLNPSLAWQATDTLSLAVGVSAQQAKATLSSAIDFGAVCFGSVGPLACAGLGLVPQSTDGSVVVDGDDWSYGWNVGLAWRPSADWTVGLTYRSGIEHKISGRADFTVPPRALPLTAGGAFTDTSGSAELDLPAIAELGGKWQANPILAVYGSLQWKQWSSLEELRVDFTNPAQPDSVEPLHYADSMRYSLGLEYAADPHWLLRAGLALDQSPTKAQFRTARIPDNDRQVYALGASWTPADAWTVDFAYNRIQIDGTQFDHTGNFGDRVIGKYTGDANVVSVGATRRF